MRQRVVIAMALSCNPKLLIADEPTTALDVTTQAQILDLMGRLQETHGSSIVIITHDMGVIAEIADRVVVMYAGRPVEIGPEMDIVRSPRHPYTWGLLGAVPRADMKTRRLVTIPGNADLTTRRVRRMRVRSSLLLPDGQMCRAPAGARDRRASGLLLVERGAARGD